MQNMRKLSIWKSINHFLNITHNTYKCCINRRIFWLLKPRKLILNSNIVMRFNLNLIVTQNHIEKSDARFIKRSPQKPKHLKQTEKALQSLSLNKL